MVQSSLLSYLRIKIPEIASTDVISDVNLLIVLNLACTEFIKETDALPTSGTFNLVLNQSEYSLSTCLPTYGKVRKEGLWIYNLVNTKWTRLDPTTIPYLNQNYPSWLNTAAGLPYRYSLDGDTLTLHPKASSTYAGNNYLKLFYYKRSVDMSNSSHYPFAGATIQYTHLANYERVLIDYVRYEVKEMLGKAQDAAKDQMAFYTKCGLIKKELLSRPDLISEIRATGAGNFNFHKGAF